MTNKEYYVFKKDNGFMASPTEYLGWRTTTDVSKAFSLPTVEEANKALHGVMLTRGLTYKIKELEGTTICRVTLTIEEIKE